VPSRRPAARAVAALAAPLALALLSGCAPIPPSAGGAGGGGDEAGGGAPDCSAATTEGYELFVDPQLAIEPVQEVYPLEAGDAISFDYAGNDESQAPTYSWATFVIQDDGTVAPVTGAPFFDEEDGVFRMEGPQTVLGNDGGPYAGFLEVQLTQNSRVEDDKIVADQSVLARLCVAFALSE